MTTVEDRLDILLKYKHELGEKEIKNINRMKNIGYEACNAILVLDILSYTNLLYAIAIDKNDIVEIYELMLDLSAIVADKGVKL